jgi:sulfate adenylyltransferase subunit 1
LIIKEFIYKFDIDTFRRNEASKISNTNDSCKFNIRVTAPIMIDDYNVNKETGSFMLIDEAINITVAAGMIC